MASGRDAGAGGVGAGVGRGVMRPTPRNVPRRVWGRGRQQRTESAGASLPGEGNSAARTRSLPTSCKCQHSRCLKLYCDCFSRGERCNGDCMCVGCRNTDEHISEVQLQTALILAKNPTAFTDKKVLANANGCNCTNSMCLKGYCDCYRHGRPCTAKCKCTGCGNIYGCAPPLAACQLSLNPRPPVDCIPLVETQPPQPPVPKRSPAPHLAAVRAAMAACPPIPATAHTRVWDCASAALAMGNDRDDVLRVHTTPAARTSSSPQSAAALMRSALIAAATQTGMRCAAGASPGPSERAGDDAGAAAATAPSNGSRGGRAGAPADGQQGRGSRSARPHSSSHPAGSSTQTPRTRAQGLRKHLALTLVREPRAAAASTCTGPLTTSQLLPPQTQTPTKGGPGGRPLVSTPARHNDLARAASRLMGTMTREGCTGGPPAACGAAAAGGMAPGMRVAAQAPCGRGEGVARSGRRGRVAGRCAEQTRTPAEAAALGARGVKRQRRGTDDKQQAVASEHSEARRGGWHCSPVNACSAAHRDTNWRASVGAGIWQTAADAVQPHGAGMNWKSSQWLAPPGMATGGAKHMDAGVGGLGAAAAAAKAADGLLALAEAADLLTSPSRAAAAAGSPMSEAPVSNAVSDADRPKGSLGVGLIVAALVDTSVDRTGSEMVDQLAKATLTAAPRATCANAVLATPSSAPTAGLHEAPRHQAPALNPGAVPLNACTASGGASQVQPGAPTPPLLHAPPAPAAAAHCLFVSTAATASAPSGSSTQRGGFECNGLGGCGAQQPRSSTTDAGTQESGAAGGHAGDVSPSSLDDTCPLAPPQAQAFANVCDCAPRTAAATQAPVPSADAASAARVPAQSLWQHEGEDSPESNSGVATGSAAPVGQGEQHTGSRPAAHTSYGADKSTAEREGPERPGTSQDSPNLFAGSHVGCGPEHAQTPTCSAQVCARKALKDGVCGGACTSPQAAHSAGSPQRVLGTVSASTCTPAGAAAAQWTGGEAARNETGRGTGGGVIESCNDVDAWTDRAGPPAAPGLCGTGHGRKRKAPDTPGVECASGHQLTAVVGRQISEPETATRPARLTGPACKALRITPHGSSAVLEAVPEGLQGFVVVQEEQGETGALLGGPVDTRRPFLLVPQRAAHNAGLVVSKLVYTVESVCVQLGMGQVAGSGPGREADIDDLAQT